MCTALVAAIVFASAPAQANIIGVSGPLSSAGGAAAIIAAPGAVLNSSIFAPAQRGFDEQQNVLLTAAIQMDGGVIAAGTRVRSHMIMLNKDPQNPTPIDHPGVTWTFSTMILGVMSDLSGNLEAASTGQLGSLTTLYPTIGGPDVGALGGNPGAPYAGFQARGLETINTYNVSGSNLTVNLRVNEPGDRMRVITKAPEPSSFLLLGAGLLGLLGISRRMSA